MSALARESLEWVLLELENKEQALDPPIETVCINCYEPECVCGTTMMWPIRHVINKLRVELDAPS